MKRPSPSYNNINNNITYSCNLFTLQANLATIGVLPSGWNGAVRRNFTQSSTIVSRTSVTRSDSSVAFLVTHHRGRRGRKTASRSASTAGWESAKTTTTGRWRYVTWRPTTPACTGSRWKTNSAKSKARPDSRCWVSINSYNIVYSTVLYFRIVVFVKHLWASVDIFQEGAKINQKNN